MSKPKDTLIVDNLPKDATPEQIEAYEQGMAALAAEVENATPQDLGCTFDCGICPYINICSF